ncbi:MAG: type II toxin-antitoxin system VapC family toxin [Actinobacteria bacterium]|nr:type II toxin-antitoxin system VapC family toxin [Actinomycetota bacterium]
MIVIDSSAMVEALVGRDADEDLLDALEGAVHAPHLLDVEVLSVLRGLALGGKLELRAAEQARNDYFALTIARYEVHGLADQIWELRHNYTTYDACYLALAKAMAAPLLTCDHKLAHDGHGAEVRVFPRTLPDSMTR